MSRKTDSRTIIRRLTKTLGDVPTALVTWFFSDTASLYTVLGRQPGVGNYLNLGWWPETTNEPIDESDITEACRELVRQFAHFGELEPENRILDVGFGFGQQDVLLAKEFGCRSITGINITPHHVRKARNVMEDNGLSDSVSLHLGDAVNLPFDENSFDVIFALETAFHFHTREDFFAEAQRVLQPGGKLLTADIIDGPDRDSMGPVKSLLARAHEAYWNIPPENRVDRHEYRQTLSDHEFEEIVIRDVSNRVLDPWVHNYLPWRLSHQAAPLRWLGQPILDALVDFYESDYFSYVFTRSRLPASD